MYTENIGLANIFERKGFKVTFGGIDQLFGEIARTPAAEAAAGSLPVRVGGLPLSLVSTTIDVDHASTLQPDVRRMFSGAAATYGDIARGNIFDRDAVTEIIARLKRSRTAAILGVAGVGKTTLARIAMSRLREEGLSAWEHKSDMRLDAQTWSRFHSELLSTGRHGVVLIDDVTAHQRQANEIVNAIATDPAAAAGLRIVVTAEAPLWRRRVKSPFFLTAGEPVELRELSSREIATLAALLDRNPEVNALVDPELRRWGHARRMDFISRRCSADMFVSLRYLFSFASLDDIIIGEYNELEERDREVYRHLALLEAAGVRPHRQLIIRLLGLTLDEIVSISNDLEGVLQEELYSDMDGIYVWRTRHQVIAKIIAEVKFADPAEHEKLLRRIVGNLNPTIDIERRAIRELCNADFGIRRIADRGTRIALFEELVASNPRDSVLRHRSIGEYLEADDIRLAGVALDQAVREVGWDPPLRRYRVRLLRQRARLSEVLEDADRRALLNQAWDYAKEGTDRHRDNYYSYLELDRVARDWHELTGEGGLLEASIRELRDAYDRLLEPELLTRATASERYLAQADRERFRLGGGASEELDVLED